MFCELPANTAVRYILTLLPQRNPLYGACVPTRTMLRQLNSDADYEAEIVLILTRNLLMMSCRDSLN